MGIEKRLIEDANLTRGMQLATPERITKVIRDVLKGEVGARVKVYEQTCMRCGACAKACHFSLSHPDDASYTPVAKLDKTIFKMVRESGKLNAEQMRGIAQIAHTECNMCRRCIHYCPVGVDIAYLMSLVRRICNKLGITPTFIQDTANSHSATFNQMWVREDEWIDSLVWQEEEAREEFPGIRIPLDKEGADFMYSVIAPEPKFRTQLIYQAAAIFHQAGSDWTMPSRPGWDNSDMCMFTGDYEMMGRIKRAHFASSVSSWANAGTPSAPCTIRATAGSPGRTPRSRWSMPSSSIGSSSTKARSRSRTSSKIRSPSMIPATPSAAAALPTSCATWCTSSAPTWSK